MRGDTTDEEMAESLRGALDGMTEEQMETTLRDALEGRRKVLVVRDGQGTHEYFDPSAPIGPAQPGMRRAIRRAVRKLAERIRPDPSVVTSSEVQKAFDYLIQYLVLTMRGATILARHGKDGRWPAHLNTSEL